MPPFGLLLLVLCILGTPGSASGYVPVSQWAPPCSPNDLTTDIFPRRRCVAGALLPTRGFYKAGAVCLLGPDWPGTIYLGTTACGRQGAEAIAQARVIRHLGGVDGGVNPDVQWEVTGYQNIPPEGKRRADVTFYDHTDASKRLQVFELKQVSNDSSFTGRRAQMLEYVALLDGVTNTGATPGNELAGWVDLFLVDTGEQCPAPDVNLNVIDVYIGWLSDTGLFDIYRYRPPCFNPQRVPVPRPNPAEVPSTVTLPTVPDSLLSNPKPFPGNPWPSPSTRNPNNIPAPVFTPTPVPKSPIPKPTDPSNPANWTCGLNWFCYLQRMNDWSNTPVNKSTGGQAGDPHITTIDGLHYDLQAVGEFRAIEADDYGMDLQARLTPIGTRVSTVKALAFELDRHVFEIGSQGASTYLLVDHAPYTLATGSMIDFGDGAMLIHQTDGYYAAWPGPDFRPALWFANGQFRVYIPPNTPHVSGLLGNADGNPANDMVSGFGEQLPASTSAATIHGTFADSWRITQDESLFTYGAGESTATYTDRSFPSSLLKVSDLTDTALADATSHCTNAAVVDGPQFDDCVIDWAETQDANFLSSAAAAIAPVLEGGSRTIDSSGAVTESFDGTVAPNFSAARYGAGPAAGAFAGPFAHDGRYVFYVPSLPAHNSVTVQFDLVAIGDWSTNASSNTVSLAVGGTTVWTGAVATGLPSSTGIMSSGQPYAVYPVSVAVPDTGKELNAGVTAVIPVGSSRAYGIDNVRAAFSLVAPQVFDVSLPLSASNGVPASGAGNLETTASEDDYRFTAPGGKLQIDVSSCSSSLGYYVEWQLINESTGNSTASGAGCSGTLLPSVAAGPYRLAVTRTGASGTYGIAVYTAPAPQTFNVTLPATVTNNSPSTGAGNLETTASEDDYAFTTSADGKLQVDFSNCPSSLGYYVSWSLVDATSGATVYSTNGCGSTLVPNVPAGQYELVVTRNGASGTYNLGISSQPAPTFFNVTLPVSISNGAPAQGAGNLETTSSEDDYIFTTTAAGAVQVDFSNCSSSLGYYVSWSLVDDRTGASLYSTSACGSRLVTGVPASQYRLSVTRNGAIGTYNLGLLVQPSPQSFAVSLPVSISNGSPASGAGNLETTASEDDYVFTTAAAGAVQVDFSGCGSSLGYYVDWSLVNAQTGATVYSTSACGSKLVTGVAAGQYKLVVTRNGATGTYSLGLLAQPPQQVFDVTPPLSISNGSPATGAGNLETTASEDDYRFTTTSTNDVQIDFSNCGSSLGYYVDWKLVDNQSGSVLYSTSACGSKRVTGVPAGTYKVVVTRNGASGTYNLGLSLVPAPDVFNVTLPVSISNGSPASGAGNLETTASEDDYTFTTTAAGAVQVDFSGCGSSLGYYLNWSLVNAQSGATVYSTSACASKLVTGVAAGQYKLVVTRNGATGTYNLGLLVQPPPQVFNVTLPVSISNGSPASGAGNLETTASEDDYAFTTTAAGAVQVDFSGCGSSLGYYLNWSLVNAQSGATVYSTSACASKLVTGVAAGQYKLVVTRNGATGTYNLGLLVQPPPQVFDVTLPVSISNGSPASGAGNLETTASEDDYRFTTGSTGTLQLNFANCGNSLGYYLNWSLLNEQSGSTVYSTSACSAKSIASLAAGQYKVVVTHNGASGTYTLGLSLGS